MYRGLRYQSRPPVHMFRPTPILPINVTYRGYGEDAASKSVIGYWLLNAFKQHRTPPLATAEADIHIVIGGGIVQIEGKHPGIRSIAPIPATARATQSRYSGRTLLPGHL